MTLEELDSHLDHWCYLTDVDPTDKQIRFKMWRINERIEARQGR